MSKHTDNGRKMYINKDGERVMRVSEVIRTLAKDQLIFWANMLGFKKIDYKKELNRTANIGSLAHDVLENYMNPNRLAVIDYEAYDIYNYGDMVEATNALKSFFLWYEGVKDIYHVRATEYVVVGKTLGGTIDVILDGFKDPKKAIFADYKTSGDIYLTQFLQLVGYVMIYEEVNGPDTVEGVMVVDMDKKHGRKATCKFLPREKMGIYMAMFKSLFEVAYCERALNSMFKDDLNTIG